jgi:ADP-ribose pyrophosphatase YjhB (NUDIX family)
VHFNGSVICSSKNVEGFMIKLETLLEKHPNDIDSTSGVIIQHNNTILIMKKTEGGYTIPKGHMRVGETPREAMHRELKEETQLTLPEEPKFLYKTPRPEKKGGDYMYVFHYETNEKLIPTLDHEHTEYSYVEKDNLPDIYYLEKFTQ